MANIKVSELNETTTFDDNDYTMIVQNNQSKKISKENMLDSVDTKIGDLTSLKTEVKTNLTNSINSIIDADSYSTQEVKTNKTWINGKPIYRKVIDCGQLPNQGTKNVQINIQNVEFVTDMNLIATDNNEFIKYNIYYSSTVHDDFVIKISGSTLTSVRILTANDRTTYYGYTIIEYTKTTD